MRDIPIGCAGDAFGKLDAYRPYRCKKRDAFRIVRACKKIY